MTLTLPGLRDLLARFLIGLSFLHVAILAAVARFQTGDVAGATLGALLPAALALFCYVRLGAASITQAFLVIAHIGQVSILVAIFAGDIWQPDMHMFYFAALAVFAGFCDWRPIVLGALLIALHHLALELLLPAAVFYQDSGTVRVVIHIGSVVGVTAFLAAIAVLTEWIFIQNDINLRETRELAERESETRERKMALMEEAEARATQLRDMVSQFQREMAKAMSVLDNAAEEMQHNSQHLTVASDEARQQVMVMSQNSSEATRSIEHTASASQELAISIAEIGRNVTESAESSQTAARLARTASDEIEILAKTGESVGAVVEIIRGIAAQTSLLALNATIEAARAGAMGKGFAVVASEVKALATQTAIATEEVAQSIEAIQLASQRSLSSIREIVGVISDVESVSLAISFAVNEQDRATAQIAKEVQFSSDATSRAAQIMHAVEAVTARTHDAAGQLQHSSGDLASQARRIRGEVAQFCERIAAA